MRLIYSGPGNQTIQLTESPTEDTCYCAKATNACGSNTADACVIVDQPPDCICDDEDNSLPEIVHISGFNADSFFGCIGGSGPIPGYTNWGGQMVAINHNSHGFPCRATWKDSAERSLTYQLEGGLPLEHAVLSCEPASSFCSPQTSCWSLIVIMTGAVPQVFWVGRKQGGSSPTGKYTRVDDQGYTFGAGCDGPAEITIE